MESYQPSRRELERQIAVLREYVHTLADHGDAVAIRVLAAAQPKVVHHICCACVGTGVNPAIDGMESDAYAPVNPGRPEINRGKL
jgi:hypothetical protein